jgi:hypothetical protein
MTPFPIPPPTSNASGISNRPPFLSRFSPSARTNLEPWPNVDVHAGDGGEFDLGTAAISSA